MLDIIFLLVVLCLLPCFALFLTYVCMCVCMYACLCVCECVCCLPFRRLCLISFFTPVPFVPFVLLSRALSHYRLFPNLFLPPALTAGTVQLRASSAGRFGDQCMIDGAFKRASSPPSSQASHPPSLSPSQRHHPSSNPLPRPPHHPHPSPPPLPGSPPLHLQSPLPPHSST
jgi:hypothetical protein